VPGLRSAEWLTPVGRLLQTSRPAGWFIAWGVLRVGMGYGHVVESWRSTALQVVMTAPLCMWLFGWNDLADESSDAINPRKGSWLHGARLREEWRPLLRRVVWVSLLFPVALIGFLPLDAAICLTLTFALAWAYSMPPLRLKEVPLADGFASAGLLFLVFSTGFCLGAPFGWLPYATYAFLPSIAGVHLYAAVVDYDPDRKAGQRTTAVRLGERPTLIASLILTGGSLALALLVNYAFPILAVLLAQFLLIACTLASPRHVSARIGWIGVGVICFGALCLMLLFRW